MRPGTPTRPAAGRPSDLAASWRAEIASSFDPTGLVPLEAEGTLEDAARQLPRCRRRWSPWRPKTVSDASAFERGQDRSADHFVSRTLGTSVKNARDLLETAEALQSLPATEAAARRGDSPATRPRR